MKVLFVDDETDILEQAKIFLEREEEGLDIDTVPSAEEALELLEKDDYDGIVSDYQMPGMDGLEFLEVIRKDRSSDIPFIIFTGRGREEVAIKALNLGAERYLEKGGDPKSQYSVLARAIVDEVERAKVEEELRKSERKFRKSFEAIPDLACLIDDDGVFVDVNEAALQTLGFEEEEIVGSSLHDAPFFPDKTVEKTTERFERRKEEEKIPPYPIELETKNGERIIAEVNVEKFKENGFEGEIAILRDVTERKEAEEKLKKTREKYRRIAENIGDLIAEVDQQGEILYANSAHREVSGYEPKEVLGENAFEYFHPEDRDRVVRLFKRGTETGKESVEARFKCEDGSYKWIESSGRFLPNGRAIIVSRDITERKEAEERVEYLHTLLRHDVRNKAQSVQGYLELLKDTDLSEEQKKLVEKAMKGSRNETGTIEKIDALLEVEGKERIGEVSVGSVIKSMIGDWETQASEKGISVEYEDCECKVRGDPLLEDLFSNLLENSIKHSGCEKVRISSEEAGDVCIVTVEDDGCGISDEDKGKIFGRGYKSGETAGSGLGLFLVKEIAGSYGGSVEAGDSELGGARFDVHLKKA